ncbi:hypothetical protein quinque_000276 [Culex quinquefasciatus]
MDDDALAFVPEPAEVAGFSCVPCSDVYEEFRAKEDAELKAKNIEHPKDLFYLRQYVHNACGTIALVHAVLNNPDIELTEGSVMKKYLDGARDLSPEERGKLLENDAGFTETHESVANEGQTAAPDINEKVYHHFVAFVHHGGKLYELDGRKMNRMMNDEDDRSRAPTTLERKVVVTQLGLCEVSGGYDMAGTFDDCACDCEQLLPQMTMIEWCVFFLVQKICKRWNSDLKP